MSLGAIDDRNAAISTRATRCPLEPNRVIPLTRDTRLAETFGNVHPLSHIDGRFTYIDGTAVRAKRATAFHNGHGVTVVRQPVGKSATRNSHNPESVPASTRLISSGKQIGRVERRKRDAAS
jgi:hypothetical protein